ncbi:hypothetical protein BGX27_009368, partial [Mortierella sp. AM989]
MTPITRSTHNNAESTVAATKESTPDNDLELPEFNEDSDEDYDMTDASELDEDTSDTQQEIDTDGASVTESVTTALQHLWKNL